MPQEKGSARSALSVAVVMLLSEISAYLGDLAFASHYGATQVSDAYVAANSVLGMPLMLLAACVSATFIPHYLKRQGRQADLFASNVLGVLLFLACSLTLLMLLLTQPLARALHPGFDQARLDMTVRAARIMLPALPFMVLAMLLGQILEADGRFLAGQAAVFPRSMLLIAACALFSARYGLTAVAASALAAGVVQAALMLLLARGSFHYVPHLDFRAGYLADMARHALPALMAMGANQVNMLVNRALASGLRVGDMTAMSFSMQLVMLVNTVITLPMTTVMFPRMSRLAAAGQRDKVLEALSACAGYILLFLIPTVCVGCVGHLDIIRLAYGRGLFDEASVRVTAAIFALQLPGALGMGLRMLLTSAFHAFMDTRTPLYVTLGAVAANIALCLTLAPRMGAAGLALSNTLSSLLGALALAAALKRKYKGGAQHRCAPRKNLIPAGRICLLAAWALDSVLPGQSRSLTRFSRLLLIALPAGCLYCLCLAFLRYEAAGSLRRSL